VDECKPLIPTADGGFPEARATCAARAAWPMLRYCGDEPAQASLSGIPTDTGCGRSPTSTPARGPPAQNKHSILEHHTNL